MTPLEFAKNVRELIDSEAKTALCLASAVAGALDDPDMSLEFQFDRDVRRLCEQYGGVHIPGAFMWERDEHGKAMRLAVCDHIIQELEASE